MPDGRTELETVLSARDETSKEMRKVRKSGAAMGRSLKRVFAGITIAAGVAAVGIFAITRSFNRAAKEIDRTLKLSERLGVGFEFLQVVERQAGLAGVELQSLHQGLSAFTRRLGEAQKGNDAFAKGFRDLGVDINQFRGDAKEVEKIYAVVIDRLAQFSSAAEKSAKADIVFSEAGRKLVSVLDQGSEGLRKATKDARDFNQIVSADEARGIAKYNDTVADLSRQWRKFIVSITPLMEAFAKTMQDFIGTADNVRDRMQGLAVAIGIYGEALGLVTSEQLKNMQATLAQERSNREAAKGYAELAKEMGNVGRMATVVVTAFRDINKVATEPRGFIDGIRNSLIEIRLEMETLFERGQSLTREFLRGLSGDWESLFFDVMDRRIKSLEDLLQKMFQAVLLNLGRVAATAASQGLTGLLVSGLQQPFPGITSFSQPTGPGPAPIPESGGGGGSRPSITIIVNALDPGSFADLARRNPEAITAPVVKLIGDRPDVARALQAGLSGI